VDIAMHEYPLHAGEALNPNTVYYWRVRSVNSEGEYGQWSVTWTLRMAMLPPTLSAPADRMWLTNRRPTLDWSDVVGASNYTIQIATDPTFTNLVLNATITPSGCTPITNLPIGTLYWRVRANGPNGPGNWSVVWSLVEQ
jgi:hypothetical protein